MSEEFLQHTSGTNDGSVQNLPKEHNSNEFLELDELIAELPKEDQNVFRELIFVSEEGTYLQGPLPPPEALKRYNEAVGDGAERIFRVAERIADYDMELEKMVILKRERRQDRGLNYAFLISLALLAISAVLIWQGHDLAGTALGTLDIIGLATVFILGRRKLIEDME